MIDRETHKDDTVPDSEIAANALLSFRRGGNVISTEADVPPLEGVEISESVILPLRGTVTNHTTISSHQEEHQTKTDTPQISGSAATSDSAECIGEVAWKDAAHSIQNNKSAMSPSSQDNTELNFLLKPTYVVPSLPPTTDDGDDQPCLLLDHPTELNETVSGANEWLVNGSPHRSSNLSRVSSMGSTMNCFDNPTDEATETIINMNHLTDDTEDDCDDDEVVPSSADAVFDPMVLFMDKSSLRHNGIFKDNSQSHLLALNSDDKSIRSESTRPDPPSLMDGQNPRSDTAANDDFKEKRESGALPPVDVPETVNESMREDGSARDKLNGETIQTTRETTSVQVEMSLIGTTTVAFPTELPLETNKHAALDWDFNRSALLATTPEAETKWMAAPSSSTTIDTTSLPKAPQLFEGIHSTGGATDSHDDAEESMPPKDTLPHHQFAGPDNLVVLPRVDEHRFYTVPHASTSPSHFPPQMMQTHHLPLSAPFSNTQHQHHGSFNYVQSVHQQQPAMMMQMNSNGGRRKVRLRLQEEVRNSNNSIKRHFRSTSLFGTLRKSSKRMFGGSNSGAMQEMRDEVEAMPELYKMVDRGSLTVSWYEGTSSLELQLHVRKSVSRKLKLENSSNELDDIRVLDDSVDPPEEVVLAPYMPDGAQFLLRFSTVISVKNGMIRENDGTMTPLSQYSGRAPISPSAAPSPHPDKNIFSKLNANQLALLNALKVPTEGSPTARSKKDTKNNAAESTFDSSNTEAENSTHPLLRREATERETLLVSDNSDEAADESEDESIDEKGEILQTDDPIESRLREITELLLSDRKKSRLRKQQRQGEKRQVIFIVANYFVLFLALIAISAELQARAPSWLQMMEDHLQSVKNCSENQEVLMECVSRGDFAGLIASVLLWLSRSVATKRIFLFGFDTPKKLWTVVYESLVSSICWGISYLFIRRGMNSDTRPRFVQKYWKDAVYGSLAGFNAAFLKHVLKNLIPEDVVEGALRERQLKMFGWLHSFE